MSFGKLLLAGGRKSFFNVASAFHQEYYPTGYYGTLVSTGELNLNNNAGFIVGGSTDQSRPGFVTNFWNGQHRENARSTLVPNGVIQYNTNGSMQLADGFFLNSGFNENSLALMFQKTPGFCDVVRYQGVGSGMSVSHDLGEIPGAVIYMSEYDIEKTYLTHRSMNNGEASAFTEKLNLVNESAVFVGHTATDLEFGLQINEVNDSGTWYTALLFAHNPDNGIYCGYVQRNDVIGQSVDLGWKPQALILASDMSDPIIVSSVQDPTNPITAKTALKNNGGNTLASGFNFTSTGFEILQNGGWSFGVNGEEIYFIAIKEA